VTIRVLVVDDQALVRTGFRLILESEPDIEVVGEAGDGNEAISAVERFQPDVVLMDVRMPRMDGLEATRRILQTGNTQPVRVLMLTTFELDEYIYESLRAGASGFLLKDVPADQLLSGIRAVAAGQALLAPSVTHKLIEHYTRQRPWHQEPQELASLTPREREVLQLLARGQTNAEIAKNLVVGETTAKTHVARILQKLDLRDRVQLVIFAYESGLIEPGASCQGH
jgi:DNA-binding NarL/FixJ family response regulator